MSQFAFILVSKEGVKVSPTLMTEGVNILAAFDLCVSLTVCGVRAREIERQRERGRGRERRRLHFGRRQFIQMEQLLDKPQKIPTTVQVSTSYQESCAPSPPFTIASTPSYPLHPPTHPPPPSTVPHELLHHIIGSPRRKVEQGSASQVGTGAIIVSGSYDA